MMCVDRIDFPLAGGALNHTTRESDVFSSHDWMSGSPSNQSQVPGIHQRRKELKSSSGLEEIARSLSISFTSSNFRSLLTLTPFDIKRPTRDFKALRTLT